MKTSYFQINGLSQMLQLIPPANISFTFKLLADYSKLSLSGLAFTDLSLYNYW